MVKNLPANAGDASSIPESRISHRGGNGNLLQYSCLSMEWQKELDITVQLKTTPHIYVYIYDSLVAKSCPTLSNLWTVAHQAPLSMGFARQEYWSELPFPSPWDLPYPGIEPRSPALQADFFTN